MFRALKTATHCVEQEFGRWLRETHGLSEFQYQRLVLLSHPNEHWDEPASAVGQGNYITALEGQGWVTRIKGSKRGYVRFTLALDPADVMAIARAWDAHLLSRLSEWGLSDNDARVLQQLLDAIARGVDNEKNRR